MLEINFKRLKKKIKWLRKNKLAWVFLGGLGLLVFLIFLTYHLAYWDQIYPGISVLGLDLSNQTPAQAINELNSYLQKKDYHQIEVQYDNQAWVISFESIKFLPETETTVAKAYSLGRQDSLVENFQTKWRAWHQGINLPLNYTLDENSLREQIATFSAEIYVPTVEPQIKVSGQTIIIEPGKPGQEVDQRTLLLQIKKQLQSYQVDPIILPVTQLNPQLTEAEVEETKKRAESLLGKSIKMTVADQIFNLDQEILISFLDFRSGFDQAKIEDYLKNLGQSVNRPPENAAFRFENNRVLVFKPAEQGIEIDENQAVKDLNQILNQIEKTEEKELVLTLQVRETPPAVKTEDVNDLGIKELLGQGISYFRGSIASRIHNIQLASSKLNGVLIPPGETFSFNQTLGEVSKETGYQEAYVIKEGRTILGDGGGVCQVSTTFFRAALAAGLPIIERHAHAYRVAYYEQNTQVGVDATVWDPTADLKIKNDTPAHILVQAFANTNQNRLTFEFYGTSDGRKATISKSRIWDQVPPPPDLYQDDPTLPAGTVKQVDWSAWGAKVSFDWKVVRGNEVLQERTFYSSYRPWQAVFLRGTGP
jgi:vancomycin resistance protein YoaR